MKRSMWIPEDIACPKVWFVAPPGQIPPPDQVQKGPFRVSELINMLDIGSLESDWIAAPHIMMDDDAADGRFDATVDTGKWMSLSKYFQLRIQMLAPGRAIYSPAEIASRSLNILYRLAAGESKL